MDKRTLQKSMLFTPLLPSAGPTGGEGDACPAPTINLTIWSFAIAFRAMVGRDVEVCWGGLLGEFAEMGSEVSVTGFSEVCRDMRLTRWMYGNNGNTVSK